MNSIQKELNEWADWFIPHDSKDVRDALELNSFNQLNVEKLLAINDLSEAYVFRAKDSWKAWQAAKAQAVQSKQDLLDRVNARWQLAHEQCAENWNTYSSAQMDAFDWVEQDIKELLGEAQEPAND